MNTPEEREKMEEERLARAIMRAGAAGRPAPAPARAAAAAPKPPAPAPVQPQPQAAQRSPRAPQPQPQQQQQAAGAQNMDEAPSPLADLRGGRGYLAERLEEDRLARTLERRAPGGPLSPRGAEGAPAKPPPDPTQPRPPSAIDGDAIVAELNAARVAPATFASRVAREFRAFRGLEQAIGAGPGVEARRWTREGLAAVEGAVAWLQQQEPGHALQASAAAGNSARDVCLDHGFAGLTGPALRDGTSLGARLARYGKCCGRIVEVQVYGAYSPLDAVAQAVICDGDSGREDRHKLFDPAFHVAGAYCAMHEKYGNMASIVLATDFEVPNERRETPVAPWATQQQPAQAHYAAAPEPEPAETYAAPEPRVYAAPEPKQYSPPSAAVPEPVETYIAPEPKVYSAPAPKQYSPPAAAVPEPETYTASEPKVYSAPAPKQQSPRDAPAPEPARVVQPPVFKPVQMAHPAAAVAAPPAASAAPDRDTITETPEAYVVDLGHTGPVSSAQLFKKGMSFILRTVSEDGASRREQRAKMPFPFAARNVTAVWEGDDLLLNIKKVSVSEAFSETVVDHVVLVDASAGVTEPNLQFAQVDNSVVATITGGTTESLLTLRVLQEEVARSTVRFEFEQIRSVGVNQEKVIRTKILKMPFVTSSALTRVEQRSPARFEVTFSQQTLEADDDEEEVIPI